jgi:tellurite resistance protein TerC
VLWVVFNIFVVLLLVLDACVLSPRDREIKIRRAVLLSAFWILLAVFFNVGIYFWLGSQRALEFLTGYVIEQSLSVDNLFVFLLIFSYFKVPPVYQRRVLLWGIIGAQIMRAVFILAGIALLKQFHWLMYVFGAFLVFSGFKLFFEEEKEVDPEKGLVIRVFRCFFPVTKGYIGGAFGTMLNGVWHATPLLVVLLAIETADIIFAIDSIPAVLAVTKDPFIAYSSNIFAILGLRAMYFALAGVMKFSHYLHYGLGVILAFVGIKMLIGHFVEIPVILVLGFIAVVVFVSIITSVLFPVDPKSREHA